MSTTTLKDLNTFTTMKLKCFLSSFSLLLFTFFANAQNEFFVVSDTDGHVNIRAEARVDSKIIYQMNNGMIVSGYIDNLDSFKKNWVAVQFYLPKSEAKNVAAKPEDWIPDVMNGFSLFTGYIYKDRLMNIEEGKAFKTKWVDDHFLLYNDSIKIKFSSADFQKEKHKIEKKQGFVTKIDGRFFAGTDGDLPRHEIKNFSIEINHRKIDIPKSCYQDLYEPNLNRFTNAYLGQDQILYIIMGNSDAAGWYDVIFIIKDGKYITRYVFDGGC